MSEDEMFRRVPPERAEHAKNVVENLLPTKLTIAFLQEIY